MADQRDVLFRELYDEHFARVTGYLTRIGVPRDEACEIAQDAFMRVYEHMGNVRGSLAVYAYTTARNLAHNRYRDLHAQKRGGINVSLDGIDPAASAPSAEAAVIEQEQRARTRFAIAALPKGMQQALLLRLQGKTYKEIATVLAITVDAVKSRIHDATGRLRQRLGEQAPGSDDLENDRDG